MSFKSFLSIPYFYSLYRTVVFSPLSQRRLVEEYIKPRAEDNILDIGCGPADMLKYIPESVTYVGFDLSEKYIEFAKKRHKDRGKFFCRNVTGEVLVDFSSFDVVIAFGVLHHLNDAEAVELFNVSSSAMKSTGRLITVDPCYTDNQSAIARYIIAKDRGKYVRREAEYMRLASSNFKHVKSWICHDFLRIPYTHLILECQK